MCTLIFNRGLNLLCKNRDKTIPTKEEIVRDHSLVGVRSLGSNYLSLGVNREGCGFVSAAINTPQWTAAAESGNLVLADQIKLKDHAGLESPMKWVSQLLPEAKSAVEWIDTLKRLERPWIGYNLVVADLNEAFLVELALDQCVISRLKQKDVVTNHFRSIDYGPRRVQDYPSSFERMERCLAPAQAVQSPGQMEDVLKGVWRYGSFFTVSSSMLDLGRRSLAYSDGVSVGYVQWGLKQESE